jgi:transcriptional regulator with XRE-family HTH domain
MEAAVLLRRARRRSGLTQSDLARRAGTSQATVSAYESGRKEPSVATLNRLLAAAGSRLTTEPAETPVVRVSEEELAERGRTLLDVLALAEHLPYRPKPRLGYPPLRTRSGRTA